MTNAEKYLKDGVDINLLAQKLGFFLENTSEFSWQDSIVRYFKQITQPTLTEDERVILRNIDKNNFEKIGRCAFSLYLKTQSGEEQCYISYMYHHLFQFIKERRRIRDKGVVKMSEQKLDSKTEEKIDKILERHYEKDKKGIIPTSLVILKEYKQFMPRGYNKIFDTIIPEVCKWLEHNISEEELVRDRNEKIIGRYKYLSSELQRLAKESIEPM